MAGCNNNTDVNSTNSNGADEPATPTLTYSVVATYPHDTSSFTQGLLFYNGQLLEGTGNKGASRLMQVDLATGKAIKKIDLPPTLFGEGIVVLNDTLYQLTWQEKVVLVYNAKTFDKIGELPLGTEGWGITTDSTSLIVTDGSNNLYFYEPRTFQVAAHPKRNRRWRPCREPERIGIHQRLYLCQPIPVSLYFKN